MIEVDAEIVEVDLVKWWEGVVADDCVLAKLCEFEVEAKVWTCEAFLVYFNREDVVGGLECDVL